MAGLINYKHSLTEVQHTDRSIQSKTFKKTELLISINLFIYDRGKVYSKVMTIDSDQIFTSDFVF